MVVPRHILPITLLFVVSGRAWEKYLKKVSALTFRFRHGAQENALFFVALAEDMMIQISRRE